MLEPLAIAAFMAVVANRLVDGLITPIFDRSKEKPLAGRIVLDKFWLKYVAWAVAGGLVALTNVNLFADYLPNQTVGLVLTAIVGGGGANFLHDLFDFKPVYAELEEVDSQPIQ